MDGLKEKIFELASQDGELAEKLNAAESIEALVALLAEKGLDVAVGDLQALAQPAAEGAVKLSEDELDAVAGGEACTCFEGGGGAAGKFDRTCACVIYGLGRFAHPGEEPVNRCNCFTIGTGGTHDG